MNKTKVLVTGGTGYVGGRLIQHLSLRDDIELIVTSRSSEGELTWLPSVHTTFVDWSSAENLLALCHGVDKIIHLSAMNEIDCAIDPVAALIANGVNTVRLLEAAKKSSVQRFVYLSSAHVYGEPLTGVITEATMPRPMHPYATSHRAAEDVVLALTGRMVGVVIRLSNGFGVPAMSDVNRWTLLSNDLCNQVAIDSRMVLKTAGCQYRDFITLYDVVRATAHLLELPISELGNRIFNVGSGESLQVFEFAKLVQRRCKAIFGYTPEIIRPAPREVEVQNELDFSIAKLVASGFQLSGSFSNEIDETLRMCLKMKENSQ